MVFSEKSSKTVKLLDTESENEEESDYDSDKSE